MEQRIALRAEWLAQLSEAINSAQRLAWQLGSRAAASTEARALYGRLEAARVELESLRRAGIGSAAPIEIDWLHALRWNGETGLEP